MGVIEKYLRYNMSALFSNYLYHRGFFLEFEDYFVNTYAYTMSPHGDLSDDYLYFVYYNEPDIYPKLIDSFTDIVSVDVCGRFVVIKVDRLLYIPNDNWMHITSSNYHKVKGELRAIIDNLSVNNFFRRVVNQDIKIRDEVSKIIEHNITGTNIFWKGFDYREEILDLEKLKNMRILSYREEWLIEEMNRASVVYKHIYKKVLDNSFAAENLIEEEKSTSKIDYTAIHTKLKEKLKEKTGKDQYQLPSIDGGPKNPLMCNLIDFTSRLSKVILKYKLTDIPKVEQCLLNHIDKLSYPQLQYYIDKNNVSRLVSDYESSAAGSEEVITKPTFEL